MSFGQANQRRAAVFAEKQGRLGLLLVFCLLGLFALSAGAEGTKRKETTLTPTSQEEGKQKEKERPAKEPAPREEKEGEAEEKEKEALLKPAAEEAGLRFFGYEFFRQVPPFLEEPTGRPVPRDYRLGPGDELQAVFWGPSGQESAYELVVDNQGMIYVSGVGTVAVSGKTVDEVTAVLLSRLRGRFPQLSGYVAVSKVRGVQVMVAGEAVRPGTYILPGTSTVLGALVAAGGPTERGSMRSVLLRRGGKTVATVDLYDYLIKADAPAEPYLVSGDMLFIPVVGERITVVGEVKRPAIYEIKGKARLSDLIHLAGGLAPEAYGGRAQVRRVKNKEERIVMDVSVAEALGKPQTAANPLLQDGDIVQLFKVLEPYKNVVWVEGQAGRPGAYALEEGMTVRALLDRAQGVDWRRPVYMQRADLFRMTESGHVEKISFDLGGLLQGKEADIPLKQLDRLVIYATEDAIFVDETVEIAGAVKVPGRYQRTANMRVRDLVELAGGLLPEASGEGELARSTQGKINVRKIGLAPLLKEQQHPDNLLLEDRDLVTVLETGDFQRRPFTVKVEGAVQRPGVYPLPGEQTTLYDLLQRAGGLTEEAFPQGAILLRRLEELFPDQQQVTMSDVSRMIEELLSKQYELELARHGVQAKREEKEAEGVQIPAALAAIPEAKEIAALQQATKAAKELVGGIPEIAQPRAIGALEPRQVVEKIQQRRIALKLEKLIASEGEQENIVLRPGDLLIVPKQPSTVAVVGAVMNPSNFRYEADKNLSFYISKAGGYAPDADAKRIVAIKPNGEVHRANARTKIFRGDIILVPPKFLLVEKTKSWWDRTQDVVRLIADTATTAFIISSLREVSK